jgi:hypothetical protein
MIFSGKPLVINKRGKHVQCLESRAAASTSPIATLQAGWTHRGEYACPRSHGHKEWIWDLKEACGSKEHILMKFL